MEAGRHRSLLIALWTIVSALLVFVLAGMAAPTSRAERRCTHGVSSVGPVVVAHGKVVAGSTVPDTQACLP